MVTIAISIPAPPMRAAGSGIPLRSDCGGSSGPLVSSNSCLRETRRPIRAHEKGVDWLELASAYAERMLPQIFRKGDPVLDIGLPPETRSELEDLLKKLPRDAFLADDSLGWVYQYWQADRKDEVDKSETKIGADELPAVTQLFTEDYMVLFLLPIRLVRGGLARY